MFLEDGDFNHPSFHGPPRWVSFGAEKSGLWHFYWDSHMECSCTRCQFAWRFHQAGATKTLFILVSILGIQDPICRWWGFQYVVPGWSRPLQVFFWGFSLATSRATPCLRFYLCLWLNTTVLQRAGGCWSMSETPWSDHVRSVDAKTLSHDSVAVSPHPWGIVLLISR